jgi:hypothetical protein
MTRDTGDAMSADRYTIGELRQEAEAYLEHRRGKHPKATVGTDQTKIKLFLDWLESKSSTDQGLLPGSPSARR